MRRHWLSWSTIPWSTNKKLNDYIQLRVYRNSRELANAMTDIDEKVTDIKQVDQSIIRLYEITRELHHIVSMQSSNADSIVVKVEQIQDHFERISKIADGSKEVVMGYREVG
jgi:hypothetical protein